jgi:hypothetical protein
LEELGLDFETDYDAVDIYSATVFGRVRGTTALDENDIARWLIAIIDPFGGDVVEWGYVRSERAT